MGPIFTFPAHVDEFGRTSLISFSINGALSLPMGLLDLANGAHILANGAHLANGAPDQISIFRGL